MWADGNRFRCYRNEDVKVDDWSDKVRFEHVRVSVKVSDLNRNHMKVGYSVLGT